ncbi:MAG: hypothetical protein ACJA1U_003071 [Bermanella sp.]|jgi:hypothetical protein
MSAFLLLRYWLFFILSGLSVTLFAQGKEPSTLNDSELPTIATNGDAPVTLDPPSYFYFQQDYGSESQFGPLNVWFNVGLVVPGRLGTQPQLDEINYAQGWQQVRSSLSHQSDVIDESGGTQASLEKEFIPFAHPSGAWLPNYFLHLLGEGMLSRKLQEYYLSQPNSTPMQAKIKAILTLVAAQTTNEVVEYELPWDQRLDPLADFYFNLAGIIAFSFDEVAQLLSNDHLDYYYWPGQPVIDVQDGALFNQGEQYYFRSALGFDTRLKLAIISGMPATGGGVSYPLNDTDHLSVMFATDVVVSPPHERVDQLERKTNFTAREIAELYNRSLNVYWDRKGSLMGALAVSYAPFYQVSLNLYPQTYPNLNIGGFNLGDLGIGGYVIASQGGANSVGITFSFSPVMLGLRR